MRLGESLALIQRSLPEILPTCLDKGVPQNLAIEMSLFIFFFKMGSHCAAHTGLKLRLLASAS